MLIAVHATIVKSPQFTSESRIGTPLPLGLFRAVQIASPESFSV
jgi:hypothetical protein